MAVFFVTMVTNHHASGMPYQTAVDIPGCETVDDLAAIKAPLIACDILKTVGTDRGKMIVGRTRVAIGTAAIAHAVIYDKPLREQDRI